MRIFDVSRAGYTPRIRIINLVDILFILLLFFIATTTFRFAAKEPTAVKLSLPEAGETKMSPVAYQRGRSATSTWPRKRACSRIVGGTAGSGRQRNGKRRGGQEAR